MRQASGYKTALIARHARAAIDVLWAGAAVAALAWFALSVSMAAESVMAGILAASVILWPGRRSPVGSAARTCRR